MISPAEFQRPGAEDRPVAQPARTTRSLIRWLLQLLGGLLVLWAAYQGMTHRVYPDANAVTGEIVARHSAGQSFVARYNDLTAVDVRVGTYSTPHGETRATLVLHLRSSPNTRTDLATATILSTTIVPGDAWYRFSFPPVHDTLNRPLYFQIESPEASPGHAVTLYWWQASDTARGDPYFDGSAYRDGKREEADLAFGLDYSPSPPELFGQVISTAFAQLPRASVVVAVSFLLALCAVALAWRSANRSRAGRQIAFLKWSLPIVLLLGLATGLLNMLLTPAWQGPDEHAHFAYVALLDHYGLDTARVQALNLSATNQDVALAAAVSKSMDLHNFTRLVPGTVPGGATDAGATLTWELRQPPAYYWVCAAVINLGRAVGLAPDPYTDPAGALFWVRGVSVVISLAVVALAWLAGVILGGKSNPWLRFVLPVALVLLPMHQFVAGLANNDILAELNGSALFVTITALFRWSTGPRAVALVCLSLALGLATFFTKASATAILPLLLTALLIWAGLLIFGHRLGPLLTPSSRARRAVMLCGLGVVAVVVAVLLFFQNEPTVAGWHTSIEPITRPARVQSTTAHDGEYVLQLNPRSKVSGAAAIQMLLPASFHPAFTVTVSAWARLAPGSPSTGGRALLIVEQNGRNLAVGSVDLQQAGQWQPLSVCAGLPQTVGEVEVQLAAYSDGEPIQFDDVALSLEGLPPSQHDPILRYDLVNPSFEEPGRGPAPFIAPLMPPRLYNALDVLLNPQPFLKDELWLYYAREGFRSFWGNFGWLAIPLPDYGYWLITCVCVLAACGLALGAVRAIGRRSWGWKHWLALATAIGLALGVLGVFDQLTVAMATQGSYSFPQGRYLFVAASPVLWLLLSGLAAIAGIARATVSRFRGYRANTVTTPGAGLASGEGGFLVPWGAWLVSVALALFSAYCVLVLIVPYFYGQ